jgi:hypothetical protein
MLGTMCQRRVSTQVVYRHIALFLTLNFPQIQSLALRYPLCLPYQVARIELEDGRMQNQFWLLDMGDKEDILRPNFVSAENLA